MKYECPHCHKKTITIWKKAMAGSLTSKGTTCPECKVRCVNGIASTIFRSVAGIALFCFAVYMLFVLDSAMSMGTRYLYVFGGFAAYFLLVKIFDAFFGKLVVSQWV